jgi:LPXTG-motif cell wall-anchored protein
LAPAATLTCTASHIVTAGDQTEGDVVNVAVATASYASTPLSDSDSNSVLTPVSEDPPVPGPALAVVKSQTSGAPTAIGDVITYSITARNSGDVVLDDVTIIDDNAVIGDCSTAIPTTLAVGESVTCAASHTVTVGDVAFGDVVNIAVGSASYGGSPVPGDDPAIIDTASNRVVTPVRITPVVPGPLPYTGSNSNVLVLLAAALVAAGSGFVLLGRRRRTS